MFEDFKGDESKLLSHVTQEYQIWYRWIENKRRNKLEERSLYVKDAWEDKINVHSIYLQMQMLLAMYYQDKPIVRFSGRSVFNEELADNLNKVAEFDYEQMGLDMIDYCVEFDRFYTGVGVKLLEWWDTINKVPFARHIDSLSVIPDPKGWFRAKWHRWIGFEMSMSKAEMEEKGYQNIDKIDYKSQTSREQELKYNQARWYNEQLQEDDSYAVYYHFTAFEKKKYLVTTDGSRSVILDIVYLEPETPAEKKNPLLVQYPVAFKYFSPLANDFYGISVVDLLKDKQTRFSRLFNLEYQRALRNVLGEDRIYDPNKIRDVKELTTASVKPKYVEWVVEPWESLENAIVAIPKESTTYDATNMMTAIQQQMSDSTGLDKNTLWLGADASRTLGESQLIQQNANLRLGLITKFSNWWDEDFWKIYYRSLQYNLAGEKVVRLTRSFGDYYVNFKRDDIVGSESIDVIITTKSEIDTKIAKESATFFATYATDIASMTNEFSKNILNRKKYRLQGWSPDEIRMVIRDTKEEIIARQDVQRLNYGLDALPIEEWQDHHVFLAYYERAIDSEKKRQAIEKRKQALFMFAQEPAQTQQNQAMLQGQANAGSAQLMTQSLQSLGKQQATTSAMPNNQSSNGL